MVDGVFGVERRECVDIGVVEGVDPLGTSSVVAWLSPVLFALSLLLPQAHALEAGHDFLDEIGQLVIVGDEAEAEPIEAGLGEFLELAGDRIGITYRQQPAIARAIGARRCSASSRVIAR